MANCYASPSAGIEYFENLAEEIQEFAERFDEILLLGDFNVPDMQIPKVRRFWDLGTRRVRNFSRVDWIAASQALAAKLAQSRTPDVDLRAENLQSAIGKVLDDFCPWKEIRIEKKSSPWLSQGCTQAIQEKHAAEGTPGYAEASVRCAQVFRSDSDGEK